MRMTARLFFVFSMIVSLQGANAGEVTGSRPLGVVELFTSQGCNSCPPADSVLMELSKKDDVIALGYHVDYWDYLGWKDTLGSRRFTERQYGYASSFGARTVYTPQAVVNGRADFNGASRNKILGALETMGKNGQGMSATISVSRQGNAITMDVDGAHGEKEVHLVLVTFAKTQPVKIERGENRGKTILYTNPVTRVQTIGMWHGGPQRFELPESEVMKDVTGGCAVLLQSVTAQGHPSEIIGAALIPAD